MDAAELERELEEEQGILRRYEQELRYEDDPRRINRLKKQIEYSKTVMKGLTVRLEELGVGVDSGVEPEDRPTYSNLPRLPFFSPVLANA